MKTNYCCTIIWALEYARRHYNEALNPKWDCRIPRKIKKWMAEHPRGYEVKTEDGRKIIFGLHWHYRNWHRNGRLYHTRTACIVGIR